MASTRTASNNDAPFRNRRGFSCLPLPVCCLPEKMRLTTQDLGFYPSVMTGSGTTRRPTFRRHKDDGSSMVETVTDFAPRVTHYRSTRICKNPEGLLLHIRTLFVGGVAVADCQTLTHEEQVACRAGTPVGLSTFPQERVFRSFP